MEEKKLWEKYKKTNKKEYRNKIVEMYLSLVRKIVHMMIGGHYLKEEFYSVGVIGLIDAVDKFDLSKDVQFETYASIRIRGSIKDFMRKQDWVSRNIREKERLISDKRKELRRELDREPEDMEVAKAANLSLNEYAKVINYVENSNMASFENAVSKGMSPMVGGSDDYNPEKVLEKKEMEKILAQEITKLSRRKQQIIALYYKEELNLKEIGEVLDISESRVSQIMKEINDELKENIVKVIN
jgi:RNA polymerase sigma factor for flagellar operon FliA